MPIKTCFQERREERRWGGSRGDCVRGKWITGITKFLLRPGPEWQLRKGRVPFLRCVSLSKGIYLGSACHFRERFIESEHGREKKTSGPDLNLCLTTQPT